MKTVVYFPPYQYDSATNEIVAVTDVNPLVGSGKWYGYTDGITRDEQDRRLFGVEEAARALGERTTPVRLSSLPTNLSNFDIYFL